MSPTQRALAFCKKQGWTAQVVERWNSYAKVRVDLFGCIDIVVMDGMGGGLLGVQVTTSSHMGSRLAKMRLEPRMRTWVRSPARLEIWGFAKQGPRGKRKVWVLRRTVVDLLALES